MPSHMHKQEFMHHTHILTSISVSRLISACVQRSSIDIRINACMKKENKNGSTHADCSLNIEMRTTWYTPKWCSFINMSIIPAIQTDTCTDMCSGTDRQTESNFHCNIVASTHTEAFSRICRIGWCLTRSLPTTR